MYSDIIVQLYILYCEPIKMIVKKSHRKTTFYFITSCSDTYINHDAIQLGNKAENLPQEFTHEKHNPPARGNITNTHTHTRDQTYQLHRAVG